MKIVEKRVDELIPYSNNPRDNEKAVEAVASSIREFGFKVPVVIDKNDIIIAGHTRVLASKELGLEKVPCIVADDLSDEQIKAFRLADNKTAELAEWDFSKLEQELAELEMDMSTFGFEELENELENISTESDHKGALSDKYLVPPFSVLYANKPDWIARKNAWIAKGLHSEIGRGGDLLSIQGAIHRQTSLTEKSKAFKNNSRLNSYM